MKHQCYRDSQLWCVAPAHSQIHVPEPPPKDMKHLWRRMLVKVLWRYPGWPDRLTKHLWDSWGEDVLKEEARALKKALKKAGWSEKHANCILPRITPRWEYTSVLKKESR